jgi:hypothetical protein
MHLAQPRSRATIPCRLSVTAYSVYSQLPFMSGSRSSIIIIIIIIIVVVVDSKTTNVLTM